MSTDSRILLRRTLRQRRHNIAPQRRQSAAEQAAEQIIAQCGYRRARCLGGYLAVASELDPGLVLADSITRGKQVFVPRITDADTMVFSPWSPQASMQPNRFGIPEPQTDESIPAEKLDFVIVPLLAFDSRGNRLGSGAGYYDRTFAFKLDRPASLPVLCGYAYAWQQQEMLQTAPWDVPLDLVVVEAQTLVINPLRQEPV